MFVLRALCQGPTASSCCRSLSWPNHPKCSADVKRVRLQLYKNPYLYEVHLEYVQALVKQGDSFEKIRQARQRFSQWVFVVQRFAAGNRECVDCRTTVRLHCCMMVSPCPRGPRTTRYFPLTEGLWEEWITDELSFVTTAAEAKAVLSLFERAVQDYLGRPHPHPRSVLLPLCSTILHRRSTHASVARSPAHLAPARNFPLPRTGYSRDATLAQPPASGCSTPSMPQRWRWSSRWRTRRRNGRLRLLAASTRKLSRRSAATIPRWVLVSRGRQRPLSDLRVL